MGHNTWDVEEKLWNFFLDKICEANILTNLILLLFNIINLIIVLLFIEIFHLKVFTTFVK